MLYLGHWFEGLIHLPRKSWCIQQTQWLDHVGGFLPLYRDAAGAFYSLSWLGHVGVILPLWRDAVGVFCNLCWLDQYKKKLATVVAGDPKAPFSIATTTRCRKGRYSFLWIPPLYPWSLPYNAECWAIYHFLSTIFWVFGMTRPDIEPRSPVPLAGTLTIMPMSGTKSCWRP